jgi:type I restriction enzyme S subunit
MWAGPPGVLNQHIFKVLPDQKLLTPMYALLILRKVQEQIEKQAHGFKASFVHVKKSDLVGVMLSIPSIKAEQKAIAEALSDADALIESLEQLVAKKHQIKQGAMQELLTGKRRLPGFRGKWREQALGQLGSCHRGVSYNPSGDLVSFDTESSIRLLRAHNVQNARIVFYDVQFVDRRCVSDSQLLREGDILICMASGSRELVGKAGQYASHDEFVYTFGAFMACFRPDHDDADPSFVAQLFQTAKYRAHVAVLLAGSSINNLTPGSIEAFLISIPEEKAEQAAIAAVLSDMDEEIAVLEAKLAKARQIKQGMMQELLTGRIRLV